MTMSRAKFASAIIRAPATSTSTPGGIGERADDDPALGGDLDLVLGATGRARSGRRARRRAGGDLHFARAGDLDLVRGAAGHLEHDPVGERGGAPTTSSSRAGDHEQGQVRERDQRRAGDDDLAPGGDRYLVRGTAALKS